MKDRPSTKLAAALEVAQLFRRAFTNQPVDEDCRHIGSTLDITAERGPWFTLLTVPANTDDGVAHSCDSDAS